MILEISIENNEVINFINQIKDDDLEKTIEKLLKVGMDVLNMSQLALNLDNKIITPLNNSIDYKMELISERMNSIMNTNKYQLETLNKTIEDFRGNTKTSVIKGRMGELCIEENIQKYFPECEINNTTKQSHQSDLHFVMDNYPVILIEIKTYKNNIPINEIIKFKRDLKSTGYKAGILVSTMSGISKKKQFEWELNDDNIIVYLPNSGLDGYSIMWAILFIKELNKYKTSDKQIQKAYEITTKLNILKYLIIDMENIKNIINKMKYNFLNTINSNFDNLNKEVSSVDSKIVNFINYFENI